MDREILISLAIIMLLIILNIYFVKSSSNVECANCVVEFNSKMGSQTFGDMKYNKINMTAAGLYYGYMNGGCPVIWDKTQGFMING